MRNQGGRGCATKGARDAQPRGPGMRNQGGQTKGVGDAQPTGSGMRNQGGRGCETKQVAPVFVAIVVVVLAVDQFIFCGV